MFSGLGKMLYSHVINMQILRNLRYLNVNAEVIFRLEKLRKKCFHSNLHITYILRQ